MKSANMHTSRRELTKIVDKLAYIVGIGGNIAVVPQIIKAWESEAPGLAVSTWILFMLIGFIWLIYAILHNQKPLIVAQIAGITCSLLIVLGWLFNNIIR
jgi:uncharacterized protein with PQ loop repeat